VFFGAGFTPVQMSLDYGIFRNACITTNPSEIINVAVIKNPENMTIYLIKVSLIVKKDSAIPFSLTI